MLGDPTQHQPDFEFYHGEFILTQKGTLETLKAKVLQTKPDLIILDPLVNLFRGKELNSGEDMNEVLRPLQELAKESKACILVIHHARKSGGDSIDLIQGSITITGVADGLMILRSLNGESDGKRTTLEVLLKDAENPKPVILKRNENLCWEVEGECEEVMGRSLEGDVEEALKNNTEGVTIATLMKMTGTPYKPIYQLLCKLERENKVKSQKFGEYHTKRHFWNDEDKKETNDESQKGESGEKTETENGKSDLGETKSPFSETPSVDNGDWGF